MRNKYVVAALCCFLSACQSGRAEYKYPEKVKGKYEMRSEKTVQERSDTVFDKKYLTFTAGGGKSAGEQTVEDKKQKGFQPVWVSVLPVLSRYPVASAQDGLIMTEWFSDAENPLRQLKINAVRMDNDVQITVLSRQKDGNGEWINQKNDTALADKIKDDIVKMTFNH